MKTKRNVDLASVFFVKIFKLRHLVDGLIYKKKKYKEVSGQNDLIPKWPRPKLPNSKMAQVNMAQFQNGQGSNVPLM